MKKFKFLPILLITGYFLLITTSIASAAGIVPCGGVDCNICHLFQGVSNIIDFLLKNIAFPLGVVAILYGGFMMMTSGGSEERVKKGRTALEFAVYGIIIAFAGWLIIDTILTSLVKGELDLKAFWNAFPGCK